MDRPACGDVLGNRIIASSVSVDHGRALREAASRNVALRRAVQSVSGMLFSAGGKFMTASKDNQSVGSTMSTGAPAPSDRNSLTIGPDGPILLHDVHFLEQMAHFNREKRSEEHTSELQSLMRISYAVFCLEKKNKQQKLQYT